MKRQLLYSGIGTLLVLGTSTTARAERTRAELRDAIDKARPELRRATNELEEWDRRINSLTTRTDGLGSTLEMVRSRNAAAYPALETRYRAEKAAQSDEGLRYTRANIQITLGTGARGSLREAEEALTDRDLIGCEEALEDALQKLKVGKSLLTGHVQRLDALRSRIKALEKDAERALND